MSSQLPTIETRQLPKVYLTTIPKSNLKDLSSVVPILDQNMMGITSVRTYVTETALCSTIEHLERGVKQGFDSTRIQVAYLYEVLNSQVPYPIAVIATTDNTRLTNLEQKGFTPIQYDLQ